MTRRIRRLVALVLSLGLPVLALAATGSGTNYTTTANMSLKEPIPGTTGGLGVEPTGKSWMELQNQAFTLVDAHDHTPGKGVLVPTAGLNINADLPFSSYNATQLRSTRFSDQPSTLAGANDLRCVYSSGGNLWFNNASGTPVQITSGGGIAGTPGSISGLVVPAAVTYMPASAKFAFTSNVNTSASIDGGPLTIRQNAASAAGITLQSPNGLAAPYSVTLPAALPAAQSLVTLDNLGVLSSSWAPDGTTIQVNANALKAIGVTAVAANTSAVVKGNRSAADAGADVVVNSSVTRTAGAILDVQNNGTSAFKVGYDGTLSVNGAQSWQIARLTTFFTGITSTLADIPGLSFPCASGKSYVVRGHLWVGSSNTSGTPPLIIAAKASVIPTVTDAEGAAQFTIWGAGGTTLELASVTGINQITTELASASAANYVRQLEFTYSFTTSTTGTFQLQVRRGVGISDTALQPGSYLEWAVF